MGTDHTKTYPDHVIWKAMARFEALRKAQSEDVAHTQITDAAKKAMQARVSAARSA